MQSRILPDWIDGWLAYMENTEPPKVYHKWVALSLISSAVERKVFFEWDKQIFANLYVVLVGVPACRKGTAMSPGREFLEELNIKLAADSSSKERLVQRLGEADDRQNFLIGEDILQYSSLTIYSEEFTVFLGYNDKELLQWLSDWYDCKSNWKYETKHQGKQNLTGVWVNLIGATTPGLLRDTIPKEAFGGGLNSRIIYVYADKKAKTVVFPRKTPKQLELKSKLLRDLEIIGLTAGEFQPSDEYLRLWGEWYPAQEKYKEVTGDKMAFFLERKPTHLHKVAMLMNISRKGDLILAEEDFKRALHFLNEVEKDMPKVFEGIGDNPLGSVIHGVTQFMRIKKDVSYSELMQRFYFDANDNDMISVLATLEKVKQVEVYSRDLGNNKKETRIRYLEII